ncbi:rCG58341 [Rattus norvegicus]|uniref:RCG58341 n=1 Tax=Rattus norvegicus TaxID=10116 RepID=A6J3Z7_RAT|nr:rCG58341 [Rattus norvegicus]
MPFFTLPPCPQRALPLFPDSSRSLEEYSSSQSLFPRQL